MFLPQVSREMQKCAENMPFKAYSMAVITQSL